MPLFLSPTYTVAVTGEEVLYDLVEYRFRHSAKLQRLLLFNAVAIQFAAKGLLLTADPRLIEEVRSGRS
jgi:hypothetical protein